MPSAGAPAARHQEDNVLSYTESAAGFSAAPVVFMSNPSRAQPKPGMYDQDLPRNEANFANRMQSAMRHEFGGHAEQPVAGPKTPD